MPELPEVQTTVDGLNKYVKGLTIKEVWTDFYSVFHEGKSNIKDKSYFKLFKREVVGKRITSANRKAKNVLINLSGGHTILVHLKMTGHLLYGKYSNKNNVWTVDENGPLKDPFNRFVHLVFALSNGKCLVLSDMRKFAKVAILRTKELDSSEELKGLGPEPLDRKLTSADFVRQLSKKPNGKIKQVLMDQSVISGIGNIYSDEILWWAGVHPLSRVAKLPQPELKKIFTYTKRILRRALVAGGDSMSDFRNLKGEKGNFQKYHNAYQKDGVVCKKRACGGIIKRIKLGGRSAHFCPRHQKLYK